MYKVPSYTEISHFRAPYKDSMMGFGAMGSGKMMGALKGQSAAASSPSSQAAGAASRGSAGASKGALGPIGKKVGGDRKAPAGTQEKQQKATSKDIEDQATYLSGLLWVDVNYALLGPDQRTWGYQAPPAFSKRVATANALIANPDSNWRKSFRTHLLKLLKTFREEDVAAIAKKTLEKLERSTSGFAFRPKITGTALDPAVSAIGASRYVSEQRFKAVAAFNDAAPETIVTGLPPGTGLLAGLDYGAETKRLLARAQNTPDLYESPADASNLTPVCQHVDFKNFPILKGKVKPHCTVFSKQRPEEAYYKTGPQWKLETFSSWPLSQKLAFEDAFKADVASAVSTFQLQQKQKKVSLIAGAAGAKKGAAGKVALDAASEAERKAKAAADLASQKASESLAKAQAENQLLRDEIAQLLVKPPAVPPVVEEPPALPDPVLQTDEEALVEAPMAAGMTIFGMRPVVVFGIGMVAAAAYYFTQKKKEA